MAFFFFFFDIDGSRLENELKQNEHAWVLFCSTGLCKSEKKAGKFQKRVKKTVEQRQHSWVMEVRRYFNEESFRRIEREFKAKH